MKRYTVPCEFFNTEKAPFHLYVGAPRASDHPLRHQAHWLHVERDGKIPSQVMEAFEKVKQIAIEKDLNYEDLCAYMLREDKAYHLPKNFLKNKQKIPGVRPHYVSSHKWPSYEKGKHSAGDSILEESLEQTAILALEIAKEIWPAADDMSCCARNLFLGLALYLSTVPKKELTLSEIFRTITTDDVAYSTCVVLDAFGACISPLCYALINQWLSNRKEFRDQVLTQMTTGMIEFALSPPKKADAFHGMRISLQKSFFHN